MKELALDGLTPMRPLFAAMAPTWTTAPPPDQALLAVLLMALYGIGDEAQFCAKTSSNPDFHWFLGTSPGDLPIEPVALAQTRSRLLRNSAAQEFLEGMVDRAGAAGLLADPHFTPDEQQLAGWNGQRRPSALSSQR